MNNNTAQTIVIADNAIPVSTEDNLIFPALSCQLQASKLTCLVGPHRTQLRDYLLMLAGLSKPQQGGVEVLGQQVCELDQQEWQKFRVQVGYVSGIAPLLSAQHALMNVMLPILYHLNLSFRETADKARALLTELDCHFEATIFPSQLNSFQRGQLALARALILEPLLLILDVPFNNLGAKERQQMSVLLGQYKQNRAVCMIGGLQYPPFLQQNADQIIFISEHKTLLFDSWKQFRQSDDEEVKALLSVL